MSAEQAEQHGGHMSPQDMQYHVKTWNGFLSFMKWQVIGGILVMIFLAIFRTHG